MSQTVARPRRIAWPWRDRAGRFSWLRVAVLLGLAAPAATVLAGLLAGAYSAEPWKAATRDIGSDAAHILLVSLLVTPLRYIAEWPKVVTLRRMVGLGALSYALLHLTLYAGHLGWDPLMLGAEIALRIYLTLGFTVLVGLCVLGWTSTDATQRRMGPRWKKLHRWVYLLSAGAVLHAFLQSRGAADKAVLLAGFWLWLMLWRLLPGRWRADPLGLAGLAVVATLGCVAIEYVWYATATRFPAARILAANIDSEAIFRPAQILLLSGLAMAVLAWWRHRR